MQGLCEDNAGSYYSSGFYRNKGEGVRSSKVDFFGCGGTVGFGFGITNARRMMSVLQVALLAKFEDCPVQRQ